MPLLGSWVGSANDPEGEFPLNNLPFCSFAAAGEGSVARCGVAIGDRILDLSALDRAGMLESVPGRPFASGALTDFMAAGPQAWADVRAELIAGLAAGSRQERHWQPHLHPMSAVQLLLPFRVAGYTDFYAGRHHAENVGALLRGPENALPPNWLHIPIGYNGRASTVVVSGTPVRRPLGQTRPQGTVAPVFGPSRRLDFELELGAVVGTGNPMGQPVTVAAAERMIFGHVLLNDWSARDIQAWEYQPLGPFQAKAFATTISPFVVTRAALEPFRCEGLPRELPLLPYLQERAPGFHDIRLEVALRPAGADRASVIARTSARALYYSPAQQLAHHAVCGCAMSPGDLLGSGTISGPARQERGSLLELSWGGREPLALATGETRTFLEDGDTVIFRGWAEGDGYRIGFGECRGTVLPAPAEPDWGAP
jgi:fumarylacetoacetase